ncbi:MAG: DASS family sodium-coupled anion symporter [Alphaproteobacteria bacterium]|nr:DASS family sodium-coupled anion symporter [Alphaproteobacteria bacterium]
MEPAALQVSAVAALMMCWWLSEAVPLAATALVPLVIFPFTGVMDITTTAAAYSNPVVFLFMGGFILAIGMERWNLHMRIALNIVRVVGSNANRIIAGFMLATAFLSMWISNTATVVMMLPISMSVVQLLTRDGTPQNEKGAKNFSTCMMLGLAFSASIGGVGTLIGTPPNAVFAGYVRTAYGIEIGFAQWMKLAVPIAIIMLIACWIVLVSIYPNRMGHIEGARRIINYELQKLGGWNRGEKMVAIIFLTTTFLWIFRGALNTAFPFLTLNDSGIAIMGALAMLILPVSFRSGQMLLSWRDAEKLPWGILLLFGGGLCLASAVRSSQLAQWLGVQIQSVVDVSEFVLILIIAGVIKLLTEFMSNVATITTFLPVIAAVAVASNYAPLILMVPATLAASFAFMTPVATAPNAIVFASGHVQIRQMAYAGLWLNLIAWVVAPALCYYFMEYAFE